MNNMANKKRKKITRHRGSHTHGRGFKKKARGKGHRGGVGMAGSGKRADQKKSLVLKKFGKKYFGKDKAIRKKISITLKSINLRDIESNLSSLIKKGKSEEIINLKGYKILSLGNITKKLKIKTSAASKAAVEKVKKAGGEIIIENGT